MFKFNLGDTVKDSITTFTGVVIGRTQWLNGCVRYIVQSKKLKDGRPLEGENFDEQQLELVKPATTKKVTEKRGGPRPDPRRASDPKPF